jgi:hypothetical protein
MAWSLLGSGSHASFKNIFSFGSVDVSEMNKKRLVVCAQPPDSRRQVT